MTKLEKLKANMKTPIYKKITIDGREFVQFDKLQTLANIYDYNRALGAIY